MNKKQYEEYLSNILINRFKKEYYDKIGKIPRIIIDDKEPAIIKMSLEKLEEILNGYLSPESIQKEYTIKTNHRKGELVDLRKMFCYIAFSYMSYSKSDIARHLGQDHTTVLTAINKFMQLYESDNTFRNIYLNILEELNLLAYAESIQSPEERGNNAEPILCFVAHEDEVSL